MEKTAYKATIGLEIHAELKTSTKMFCNSKNDTSEKRPNVNICPICMGHPGTLPVINKEAVKHVLKIGVALGSEIADFTEFDRKNYFYPDIPKGYQISQYKYPLVKGGVLRGVKITRIHLEEDTAKSSHDVGDYSLVDFNRAGVPLMELVTEPVIHSGEEASAFARELQLLLQHLGIGDANMEKGEMRVEANVSVSTTDKLGTKVEVKNINSFKAVEKAVAYEIERHIDVLESGKKIVQETRGWDEDKQVTFSQRLKEESHDYRYFPDPDLPKLKLSEIPEFSKDKIKKELPELPWEMRDRYKKEFDLKDIDIELYVRSLDIGKYFEEVIKDFKGDKKCVVLASNYISSDVIGLLKKEGSDVEAMFSVLHNKIPHKMFAKLISLVAQNKVSSRGAKDILAVMYKDGGDPETIAKEKGLIQQSNEADLKKVIEKIIADNPNVVAEYKSGKTSVLQFFVGQGMKATKGSANPAMLQEIAKQILQ